MHFGTIPSKTLREAVIYLTGLNQRGLYGRGYRLKKDISMEDLVHRMEITLSHETDVMESQLYRNHITTVTGTASFINDRTIRVESPSGIAEEICGDRILIAVGSAPVRPKNIDFKHPSIVDSDGILKIKKLPRTMIIVGAGVIGVEYASIFSGLDVKVTLIDGRNDILNFLDKEIVDELLHHLRDKGVVLRTGETVSKVEALESGRVITHLDSGKRVAADLIMFAAGREGLTKLLSPELAGIATDERHRLIVNDNFQTNVPHIYAAGDVIGFPSLSSTSMEQGRLAACHAFERGACATQKYFPFGIYSIPEISMIGATEKELTDKKIPYEVGVARLREIARGQIMGIDHGILKMIFSLEDRRLLGVHIIGDGATEMIHIGQAVLAHGGKLEYFLENVFNYPTLAEAYKVSALDAMNRMSMQ